MDKSLGDIRAPFSDKLEPEQKAEAIYEIPCSACTKSYIGETGRAFGVRLEEHRTEVEKFEDKNPQYTRATRTSSITDHHKSAVTDHVADTNHQIDWDAATVIDRASDRTSRWIREAIWIRRRGNDILNKDEGAYKLQNIYDNIVQATPTTPSTSRKKGYKRQCSSGQSCQSDEAASLAVKRH